VNRKYWDWRAAMENITDELRKLQINEYFQFFETNFDKLCSICNVWNENQQRSCKNLAPPRFTAYRRMICTTIIHQRLADRGKPLHAILEIPKNQNSRRLNAGIYIKCWLNSKDSLAKFPGYVNEYKEHVNAFLHPLHSFNENRRLSVSTNYFYYKKNNECFAANPL